MERCRLTDIRDLDRDRACVTVEKIKSKGKPTYRLLTGAENVGLLPRSTKVMELKGTIIDENGDEIHAEGRFFITVETIDPFHLVVDIY